ncbi:MalM family protein [Celerinatantimonas yamalensis]|uniref:MalM family protein n=1 Tax=Celerinatantimonas yamalensis TaxID=559956 RepID=A0ABW9G5G3_9GAMM
MRTTMVVLGLITVLTGCSSWTGQSHHQQQQDVDVALFEQGLAKQASCCQNLSAIDYKVINRSGEYNQAIMPQSPLFHFSDSPAYFAAFKIASVNRYSHFNVTLTFDIHKHLFLPKIIVLNDQFQVTGVLDNKFITQNPNEYVQNGSIDREIVMGGADRTYLVVYQPKEQLTEHFKIETEQTVFNRQHAYAPPPMGLRYKQMSYQPFGSFVLAVRKVSDLSAPVAQQSQTSVPDALLQSATPAVKVSNHTVTSDVPKQAANDHALRPDKLLLPKSDESTGAASANDMYSSTKPFEVQMSEKRLYKSIQKALRKGDYQGAVALYKDARAHGINDAAQIFTNALSQL